MIKMSFSCPICGIRIQVDQMCVCEGDIFFTGVCLNMDCKCVSETFRFSLEKILVRCYEPPKEQHGYN